MKYAVLVAITMLTGCSTFSAPPVAPKEIIYADFEFMIMEVPELETSGLATWSRESKRCYIVLQDYPLPVA